jgi:hypothetical protein
MLKDEIEPNIVAFYVKKVMDNPVVFVRIRINNERKGISKTSFMQISWTVVF